MGAQARGRPTLDEVALRAGVSRTVASRVINNTRDVSGTAREAVRKAVRELGYVPNPMARGLVTSQAGTVLLAVSHDDPNLFADPFFAHVIVGVNAALEEGGREAVRAAVVAEPQLNQSLVLLEQWLEQRQ